MLVPQQKLNLKKNKVNFPQTNGLYTSGGDLKVH